MESVDGTSARSAAWSTPDDPLAGLDHEDPLAVAGAVRRCGDLLRDRVLDAEALAAVVARMGLLSKDASPRVRQSVAEVAAYLPEKAFQTILAPLAKDRSPYVRDAAERAVKRRSALRRAAAVGEEHDARVERWYREIDKNGARAVARRIAAHETEYFVRQMCHEADASFMGFGEVMRRLREGIDAPEIDRAVLRAMVDRIDERFLFFKHVLETGRNHSRPAEPVFRREDLSDILADEASLLSVARAPGPIAVDLSGLERPLAMDADARSLRQAFGNILKNAVEACGAGPVRVTVTASAGPTEATVTIRDYGCGMTEHDVVRAFVPFGSSKPGGTGFGLFIARRVAVAVHGGELSLASALGEGTTVTMRLPLRQERAASRRRGKGR